MSLPNLTPSLSLASTKNNTTKINSVEGDGREYGEDTDGHLVHTQGSFGRRVSHLFVIVACFYYYDYY